MHGKPVKDFARQSIGKYIIGPQADPAGKQNSGNSNLFRQDPTSTLIYTGTAGSHNVLNGTYVDYVFAEVEGYSKFGSYTGNGSTTGDGPFVHLGFKPALVIWKRTSGSVYHWVMRDSTRDIDNPTQQTLYPSTPTSEQTLTAQDVDFLSNGFKIKTNWDYINQSGEPYIFMAWAENPFGGSGVSPATAR